MTFFTPVIVKHVKRNLDETKPHYSKQILPVPEQFVTLRFHCTKYHHLKYPIYVKL